MPSCDVLPASVAEKVNAFQQRGGIIVADERLAPAIKGDILLPVYTRVKKSDVDKQAFQKLATLLRSQLDPKYQRYVDSSNPEIITYRRRYGTTDYIFTVNDHREFGDYVGQHGLVMERGLPADSVVTITRKSGYVYDLVTRRFEGDSQESDGRTQIAISHGPASGGVHMITQRPIERVHVKSTESARPGESIEISVSVTDGKASPVDAVIPLRIDIFDPDGRPSEFTGYHAAVGGQLKLNLDMAPNDVAGMWQIRVQERASGITSSGYFRLQP
jgi:hypothetical protein